jgi:hypothetical protein
MTMITCGVCPCGETTALYEGRCHWCRTAPSPNRQDAHPKPTTINALFSALVAELAEEVPAPLSQRFTLAAIWSDLARLNGETPPAAVAIIAEGLPVTLAHMLTHEAGTRRVWGAIDTSCFGDKPRLTEPPQ